MHTNTYIYNLTNSDIVKALEPKGCAYLWNDSDLIEVPQNEEELLTVTHIIENSSFRIVEKSEAINLGYEELANWSDENDFLFLFDKDYLLLCLPKSVFKN